MRKNRKVKGKAAPPPREPQPWDPQEVLKRVNQARGDYLARTGNEMEWKDIARRLRWKPSTQTDVKHGKRPFRVAELGVLGELVGVRAGWLAFKEPPTPHGLTESLASPDSRPPFPEKGDAQDDEKAG